MSTAATPWRSERGQTLVLGVLLLALVLILMLVGPVLAIGYWERAATASAADAAALACASRAQITRYVDARGVVYGEKVAVPQSAGTEAAEAAWTANLQSVPVRTVLLQTQAAGADCTVRAQVSSPLRAMRLIGRADLGWTVTARARAYADPP